MKKLLLLTIAFTVLLISSCASKNMSGESQVDKQSKNESFVSFTKESQVDKQSKNESSVSFTKESQVDKQSKNESSVSFTKESQVDRQKKNDGSESFTKEKNFWKTLLRSEDQISESRLEEVLIALKNEDKNALRSLFSKRALSEAKDFDEHWDYLMEFFQGEIKSYDWEGNGVGPISDKASEYGTRQIQLKSWFEVVTDKQTYVFFLLDYPVDDFNSDNVGLYALRVVKAKDAETQLESWQKMQIPGIYRPE